jgi:hypothetical protein
MMIKLSMLTLLTVLFMPAPSYDFSDIQKIIDKHAKPRFWFLGRLAYVESSNRDNAVNEKTGAVGRYQIKPGSDGALEYYNTFSTAVRSGKRKRYTEQDLFIPAVNKKIAIFDLNTSYDYFSKMYPNIPSRHIDIFVANAHNAGRTGTENGNILKKYLTAIFGEVIVFEFLTHAYSTNLLGSLDEFRTIYVRN